MRVGLFCFSQGVDKEGRDWPNVLLIERENIHLQLRWYGLFRRPCVERLRHLTAAKQTPDILRVQQVRWPFAFCRGLRSSEQRATRHSQLQAVPQRRRSVAGQAAQRTHQGRLRGQRLL